MSKINIILRNQWTTIADWLVVKVSNKFKFGNMTVGFPQYEFGLKCKLCISKDNDDPISV